jgi:phenylacetate-CoA ligase
MNPPTAAEPAGTPSHHAVPRSGLVRNVWPAIAPSLPSRLLALQFQFEQSQWWPAEVIQARQFEQLGLLLDHARHTVPFYGSRLSAAGIAASTPLTPELWSRLPILTRRDIQRHADALRSRAIPRQHGRIETVSTSGSTGSPITVAVTEFDRLIAQAMTLREHFWHRRDFSATLAAIRNMESDQSALPPDGEHVPDWGPPVNLVYPTGAGSALSIKASLRDQAAWLMRENPDYLLTYPTIAVELMRYFREHALRLPKLRELRTLSEALPAGIRELAGDVWNVKLVDMYSAKEVGYIALQCPDHHHYHVQSENLLVEILDENGSPCAPGRTGRVVVSTLHAFAMPLLRYEIGDYAEAGAPCPCGRGLPVLGRIRGRLRNMLLLPNGERHWPSLRADVVHEIAPILQQQVAQTGPNRLEVRLVTARTITAAEEAAIADHLCTSLRHRFEIAFRYVDAIDRGPAGKFEEFVSELGT